MYYVVILTAFEMYYEETNRRNDAAIVASS
jgi:hypothetical protein